MSKKVAVMGYGVVGSGVVEVIYKNHESISKKLGDEIEVSHILDLRDFEDSEYKEKFTKDFEKILNDDEVVCVAEVMGGIEPAFTYTKKLLNAKKSVVTSNKELVAQKGAELLEIAKANNVNYFFEASVGGGIPIIRPLHQCLAANEINEIAGILNGTTNFILTKMIKENMTFEDALKIAQELGYAERNPEADVEGHDACRKICILSSLAFGRHIYPEFVNCQGITKITLEDAAYAKSCDCSIKLIGRAKVKEDKVEISVAPALISKDCQLSSVDDVFNAVMVRGNAIGDAVFYGRGAGKLPTASAVVADIIDAIKSEKTSLSLSWNDCKENIVVDYKTVSDAYYVRVENVNAQKISEVFGNVKFLSRADKPTFEEGFVTQEMTYQELEEKLDELGGEILTKIKILPY